MPPTPLQACCCVASGSALLLTASTCWLAFVVVRRHGVSGLFGETNSVEADPPTDDWRLATLAACLGVGLGFAAGVLCAVGKCSRNRPKGVVAPTDGSPAIAIASRSPPIWAAQQQQHPHSQQPPQAQAQQQHLEGLVVIVGRELGSTNLFNQLRFTAYE